MLIYATGLHLIKPCSGRLSTLVMACDIKTSDRLEKNLENGRSGTDDEN
jgi:hypothetical protein